MAKFQGWEDCFLREVGINLWTVTYAHTDALLGVSPVFFKCN